MLHPTHPARRASGDNGLQRSIAPTVIKWPGTNRRFRTRQSELLYCRKAKCGLVFSSILAIIGAYAASLSRLPSEPFFAFSWNSALQRGHTKSTTFVLAGVGSRESLGQAGQYTLDPNQSSVRRRAL